MDLERLFDPKVTDDHPRLQRLFEQAKQDFWNEATVVDWSREFTVPAHQRRPLARILSIIYYGERAALEVSAQLVSMVRDEQAKFVLAAQVIEEAKHVSVFRRVLTKLDEVHPADREEWGFWMDEQEGMVGWPEFQTKDGVIYGRHWLPGDRRVAPREWNETIQDARGTSSRQVHAMLYSRSTGAADPAPEAEYILVSVIEGGGEAYVEIAAGIDVNPASLTIA